MQTDHSKHRKDWYRCGADADAAVPPPQAAAPDYSEASFPKPAAGPATQEPPPQTAGVGDEELHSAEPYWQAVEERRQSRRKSRNLALALCGIVLGVAAVFALQGWGYQLQQSGTEPGAVSESPLPGGYGSVDDFFDTYYTSVSGSNNLPRTEAREDLRLTLGSAPGAASADEELSLQEIYDSVSPSVVGILAQGENGSSWGSGVIFASDGYILTNDHIIDTMDSATVSLADGTTLEASLVAHDSQSDLAILKVEAENLPAAVFGDSSQLRTGDEVVAIGNPLGETFRGTMTDGIVSAISREVSYQGHSMTVLQTNAAINEGNSGGPLLNMYGQVIGITNMKMFSYYSTIEGIGFAIPTTVVADIVNQLLEQGYVSGRTSVGITVGAIPDNVTEYYDLPAGVYVSEVVPGSGAEAAGIQPGDLITQAEGEPVSSIDELNTIKDRFAPGDTLHLTIYRDGQSLEVAVELQEAGA